MRCARVQDRLRRRDVLDGDRLAARHAAHDLLLFVARRIADAQLEHEAVDLRFGQRIRALLLDRVLRREHEERLLELERRAADRDLLLLHRLEQRRLHLGRRAIDLVGENDVGEDRPLLHARTCPSTDRRSACRRTSAGSRSGVNWMRWKRRVDRLGERAHRERLRQPGTPSSSTWPPVSRLISSRSTM